jgi:arsenate reductase
MSVTIYHNPKCSKSRQTLELLRERGIEPKVVEYLKTPLDVEQIEALLKKLGVEPRALMRTKEAPYEAAGLDDPKLTREQLVSAMAAHPIRIERPIVVSGARAAIGRPPENVLKLL